MFAPRPLSLPRRVARPGFTLIELLTVIAIIGILASIIITTVGSARNSARNSRCQVTLRGLGQAVMLYKTENRNLLPPNYAYSGGSPDSIWTTALRPYVSITDLEREGGGTMQMSELLTCPMTADADKPSKWWDSDYAAGLVFGRDGTRRRDTVQTPSRTVMFIESVEKMRAVLPTPFPWTRLSQRHGASFNAVFLDGHTAKVNAADVPQNFDEPFWAER